MGTVIARLLLHIQRVLVPHGPATAASLLLAAAGSVRASGILITARPLWVLISPIIFPVIIIFIFVNVCWLVVQHSPAHTPGCRLHREGVLSPAWCCCLQVVNVTHVVCLLLFLLLPTCRSSLRQGQSLPDQLYRIAEDHIRVRCLQRKRR